MCSIFCWTSWKVVCTGSVFFRRDAKIVITATACTAVQLYAILFIATHIITLVNLVPVHSLLNRRISIDVFVDGLSEEPGGQGRGTPFPQSRGRFVCASLFAYIKHALLGLGRDPGITTQSNGKCGLICLLRRACDSGSSGIVIQAAWVSYAFFPWLRLECTWAPRTYLIPCIPEAQTASVFG